MLTGKGGSPPPETPLCTAASIDYHRAIVALQTAPDTARNSQNACDRRLARGIATKAPLAVAAIKEQFRMLADSAPLQPGIFERIQELRHRVFKSTDYVEGIRAFKEKRNPVFRGG